MLTGRLDASGVPRQGGYIAKLCPVVIQNRMLKVTEVTAEAPDSEMRKQQGIDFERSLAESVGIDDGWLLIPDAYPDQVIAMTLSAMEARAPVIYGGWLPHDEVGRRTGKPDLLVHAGDGYVPVDIKHRKTMDQADGSMTISDLMNPSPEAAYELPNHKMRANKGDAVQLAHYRRMLEASGHASTLTLSGIVGKELTVVWYDLDEPMWTTPSTSDPTRKTKRRSSLDLYDFEYGWRLNIAANALVHLDDPEVALLVEPMWCGDCSGCGFHDHCAAVLTADTGDSSLIPNNQYQQWRELRDHGIRTRGDVAALHYPTADLTRGGVDVEWFLDTATGHPEGTLISDLRPRATKQLELLASVGITTVADLGRLDGRTARFGGFLAPQILSARAAIGPEPVYRRPDGSGAGVPRADIEVDIDMENMNEGVYLWGALVTDRVGSGLLEEGYKGFTTWEPLDDQTEQAPFLELLEWLDARRIVAAANGFSLKAYVWYEAAENTQLTRIARAVGPETSNRVENLIRSDVWVDLRKVFEATWMTGSSTSLKTIAPLAGFGWPVDDPGGGLAMVKYTEAIHRDSQEAREWILEYNRGDVEATKAIREWLDQQGTTWPEVPTD